MQPIPDSCALVPCEGRSVPFCIVGSTRALYEARKQMWEYWLKRAKASGWHVKEDDGSSSWNDVPASWARSVPADSRGLSSNDWTVFWHWSIGKWIWNDRSGECAIVNSKRPSKQGVKTFIPPWILLSYELPLLWGLHDDDSVAVTDLDSSSASEAELVIPPLPKSRQRDGKLHLARERRSSSEQ